MKDDLVDCGLHCASPLAAMRCKAFFRYTIAVLLLELLIAGLVAVSPLAQKLLIDGVNAGKRTQTIQWAVIVAIMMGLSWSCQTGSYLLRFRLGVEARCRIKSAVFHRLLGLPESFLKERGSGYFFNRLQADSMEIVGFYSGSALLQFSDLLKFLFAAIAAAFLNWKCVCIMIPFLMLQFMLYRKYREKQYRLGHKIQECTAAERYRMQEYFSGHTTLKTHNAMQQATEKLDQGFARWRILAFQRLFHENRFRIFLQLPIYLCCGIVAIYGLHKVLLREWTLGEIWAILMLFRQVFAPVQRLAVARFQMQQIQSAWDRLRQICAIDSAAQENANALQDCSLQGDIVFSDIRFAYSPERVLFQSLSFTIRNHSLFFLTGVNGAGKSTIFQLLLRLYDPQAGRITVHGEDIRNFDMARYRSRIGYLGQTPEFFPGTIRENLELDVRHSEEEIMNVMRLLKSENLIRQRPKGLDAEVQERAQNFSGGERLRLALARELLRDTDILLLDEPAASLDEPTRRDFYELLKTLHARHTILAITHDPLAPSPEYTIYALPGFSENPEFS